MAQVLPNPENGISVRWQSAVAGIHRGASISRTRAGFFRSTGLLLDDPVLGGSTLTLKVRWQDTDRRTRATWEETLVEPLLRRSIESVGEAVLISGSDEVLAIEPHQD